MSSHSNYAEVPAPAGRKFAAILLYLVGFVSCALLAARYADLDSSWAEFATAEAGAAIGIFWVWTFCAGSASDSRVKFLIYSGFAVDIVFNLLAADLFHRPSPHESFVDFAYSNLPADALMGVGNLGMVTAAIGVGLLVARGLQKPNYLLMACLVGAVTDIFNIYIGPGKKLLGSKIFPYISFQWGITHYGGLEPIVGMGDFVFLALYFFGVRKFGLDDRKTLIAMIPAVALGFGVGIWYQVAIPALPFFAISLLLVHGRELWRQHLELQETKPLLSETIVS